LKKKVYRVRFFLDGGVCFNSKDVQLSFLKQEKTHVKDVDWKDIPSSKERKLQETEDLNKSTPDISSTKLSISSSNSLKDYATFGGNVSK